MDSLIIGFPCHKHLQNPLIRAITKHLNISIAHPNNRAYLIYHSCCSSRNQSCISRSRLLDFKNSPFPSSSVPVLTYFAIDQRTMHVRHTLVCFEHLLSDLLDFDQVSPETDRPMGVLDCVVVSMPDCQWRGRWFKSPPG